MSSAANSARPVSQGEGVRPNHINPANQEEPTMIISIYNKVAMPVPEQTLMRINIDPAYFRPLLISDFGQPHGMIYWLRATKHNKMLLNKADSRITFQHVI